MFTVSWGWWAVIALALTQVVILLVTLYFHRACSHRSVTFTPGMNRVWRFLSWFLLSMDPQQFAAVHRKHHAKCDTHEDPHSPVNHGWYGVLFKGLALYQKEAHDPETIEKYGKGLPVDPWEGFYRKHKNAGILALAIILTGLMSWKGLLLWALLMLWIPLWAAGVINGLGHHFGYRNFSTDDRSTNLSPWGLWIGGEELHNNHHAYPTSPKFSQKPWEVDLGWGALKVMMKLGLAQVRQVEGAQGHALLRDRFGWMDRLHAVIEGCVGSDLKQHGFSRWSQFVESFESRDNLSGRKRQMVEQAISQPTLSRVLELEREFVRFWQERGHFSQETLARWKEKAAQLGWKPMDDFCQALPA